MGAEVVGGLEDDKDSLCDKEHGLESRQSWCNSGPHGGHAAPWGGREIRAGTN